MGLTTQSSKRLAQKLMRVLIARKYEPTLCRIANHPTFNTTRLDLSIPEATALKKQISDVVAQYEEDFNATPPPMIGTIDTTDRLPADPVVSVKMDEVALDPASYKVEQAKFDTEVQTHKKRKVDDYLNANVSIIVDDGVDTDRRKRKLLALPVAAEKRRKLFVKDYMTQQGIDWERLRERHQSVFDPLKPNISEEGLDQVFDIYRRLKSDGDDRKTTDHIVLIVPGPPPNSWENKNVATAVKHMKKGLGLAPKIGRIEHPQADVLLRSKAKHSFTGHADNFLVFGSEAKVQLPRKMLTFLGGDTHFNKWVVPLIPLGSLLRIDPATHKNLFAEQDEVAMEDQEHVGEIVDQEIVCSKDQLIPFPQDWVGTWVEPVGWVRWVGWALWGVDCIGGLGGLGGLGGWVCHCAILRNTTCYWARS